MSDLVSLIMPAWRPRADWINQAVESALQEDACDLELIVVDDGSDEPVAGLLAGIDDLRLRIIRVEHAGPYAARNAGIAAAHGSYIRFVDADDVVEPGSTGRLLARAHDGGETIVYGATMMCDDALVAQRIVKSELEGDVAEQCLLGAFDAYHVSMLFPRAVVERAGPWEERGFAVSGDWDFVLRAVEQAPVRRLNDVVARYRRHPESITKSADVDAGARAGRLVLDRYFVRNPDQRGTALERAAYLRLHLDRARAHASRGQRLLAGRQLARALRRDPGEFGQRARAALADRVRLRWARRLEASAQRSETVRGAAIVFHTVAMQPGDHRLELDPALAVDRLDVVVGYLARRYRLVHAAELPAAARLRRAGEPLPVAVTFDDDLPSHREIAAPILTRHGAVATAFLCGARSPFWWQLLQTAVDSQAIAADALPHVDRDLVAAALERRPRAIGRLGKAIEDLEPAQRDEVATALEKALPGQPAMLGQDGVAALVAAGWEIGFHTRRHDLLTALDDDALRHAVEHGRDEATGTRALTLAYPHGKAGAREAEAARAAGYVAAYTGRAEILTERTNVHLIGRLQPDTASVGRFALELARALSAP